MSSSWLHIVGIGDDGIAGLNAQARLALENANHVIASKRIIAKHEYAFEGQELITWPSPYTALLDRLKGFAGEQTCVLVTGDPLWFSAGEKIAQHFSLEEMRIYPFVSSFQLAASRMAWSLRTCETISVHGRAVDNIVPYLRHGAKLLLLTSNAQAPHEIADILCDHQLDESRMVALAHLGSAEEMRAEAIASDWAAEVPNLHVLAIECKASTEYRPAPRSFGLLDSQFEHDGKMTKSATRAVTLSRLQPARGELLWDIGLGCGSVAIEWLRASPEAEAIGLEPNEKRREFARRNADRLGSSALKILDTKAPEGLAELPRPNAIFIGGGLSRETFDFAWQALLPAGRMVINAVTLQSEAILLELYAEFGGDLMRLGVQEAQPVGPFDGWKPLMTVTQLALIKEVPS